MCAVKKAARSLFACLLCFVLVFAGQTQVFATGQTTDAAVCTDYDQAVEMLRANMVARQPVVTIRLEWDSTDSQIAKDILNDTFVHTGIPKEGDYLYWHMRKCSINVESVALSDGRYQLELTYTMTYRSNAEQEEKVDAAVKTLLDQLDVYEASDYQKICAIYDYMCKNIQYDSTGAIFGDALIYTAYAALIRKEAVCQGYATLFYRLALELGVDNRVISGVSKRQAHGWNIVRLGENYYNLDTTWDATSAQAGLPYGYYLRCDANFESHVRDAAFDAVQFRKDYPVPDADCDIAAMGDPDQNGRVDEDDAIYLLQHVLMPAQFRVNGAVDYDENNTIDEDDVIYLLQYVLMPEDFPLP